MQVTVSDLTSKRWCEESTWYAMVVVVVVVAGSSAMVAGGGSAISTATDCYGGWTKTNRTLHSTQLSPDLVLNFPVEVGEEDGVSRVTARQN